jgi:hypothetical protein
MSGQSVDRHDRAVGARSSSLAVRHLKRSVETNGEKIKVKPFLILVVISDSLVAKVKPVPE